MDFPIRAVVAWRQIAEARMWRRNGNAAYQLALNYATPPLCRSLRDLDFLLIQFSAGGNNDAALGAEKLWRLFIDRFGLHGYATDLVISDPDSKTPGSEYQSPPKPQDKDHPPTMMLNFFETMNQIVTELPLPPNSENNIRHTIRREIIHYICSADSQRLSRADIASAAINGVTVNEGDAPSDFMTVFDEVLHEIVVNQKYTMKPELFNEYDPSFYHTSKAKHQSAMEKVSIERKDKICPLVMRLKKSHKLFAKTRDLLKVAGSFEAVRRWLLFAILGGEFTPSEEKNRNFSPKTIQESPVSILEVLQFCTLQFHEVFASSASARPEAVKAYLTGITTNMPTLAPDAWIFRQLPTSDPHGLRPSVLGMLGILYEFFVCADGENKQPSNHGGAQPQNSGEDHNSGARELVISGLTWLLRAVQVLMDEPTLEFEAISSKVQGGRRASSTHTQTKRFPDLPSLWPAEQESPDKIDADGAADGGSAKKKQYKAAQAKAMARIKAQQSKFSATLTPDALDQTEDEDECIICRCSNNEPLAYIGHVQRCRVARNLNRSTEKLNVVVGTLGCQLRATKDMKSEKVHLAPMGSHLYVVEEANNNENPLQSRRTLVEDKEGHRGWASFESSSGYEIVRSAQEVSWRGRWGSTRPLIKTCGHIAHTSCVETHILSLHQKAVDGTQYAGMFSANISQGEFLCPLCHSISNTLIPKATEPAPDGDVVKDEETLKILQRTAQEVRNCLWPHFTATKF